MEFRTRFWEFATVSASGNCMGCIIMIGWTLIAPIWSGDWNVVHVGRDMVWWLGMLWIGQHWYEFARARMKVADDAWFKREEREMAMARRETMPPYLVDYDSRRDNERN